MREMVGGAGRYHHGLRGQFTGVMMPTVAPKAALITRQVFN